MKSSEFLELSKKHNIEAMQITENEVTEIEIKTINSRMKENSTCINCAYTIIAKIDGKYVSINANYLNEELIDLLFLKRDNLETTYEEEFVRENIKGSDTEKLDIDTSKELQKMLEFDSIRKKSFPLVEYIEGYYSMSQETTRIINTLGVDMKTTSLCYVLYVSVTAKKDQETASFDDLFYSSTKKDIDFSKLAINSMTIAEKSLTKEKIKSNKYKVVLSPSFSSNILSRMIPLFSSECIRKKTSCFENKLNSKIFSDKITIIEDPKNKNMPAYTLFDEEGIETQTKELIKDGVLVSYLYNNKEAKLANCKSTGNGYDNISVRNLYIKPGKETKEELIKEIENGLYIRSYQESGGTTVNTTTGVISVQVYGSIIKDGKIGNDFEPCILTTNIFEMFSNVEKIGNDLEFKTSVTAAPSMIVDNLSISSN